MAMPAISHDVVSGTISDRARQIGTAERSIPFAFSKLATVVRAAARSLAVH